MCASRVYGTSAISSMPITACTWYSTGTPAISPVSGLSRNRPGDHGAMECR
jgi:hypothetical protein